MAWSRRRDFDDRLRFEPYQEAPSPPMTPELQRACARALHVLTPDGRKLRGGRASLYVLEKLGYRRLTGILRLPPLVWAVELGYQLVARNRGWIGRFLGGDPRKAGDE